MEESKLREKKQIILSGVGGQGLVSAGTLLAKAAVEENNLYATLTSKFGSEMRGTFTKSDVVIHDKEIYHPEIIKPNIILAMAQVAYDRYIDLPYEDIFFIYDSSIVENTKDSVFKQKGLPFTEIARNIGNAMTANTIALGVIVELFNLLDKDSVIRVINNTFKNEKVQELNRLAFEKGIEIAHQE